MERLANIHQASLKTLLLLYILAEFNMTCHFYIKSKFKLIQASWTFSENQKKKSKLFQEPRISDRLE